MHAHAREGDGGGQVSLDRPVVLPPGVRLRGATRGFGCIFMKGDALMAGQQVAAGKGSPTLADEGLLFGVWEDELVSIKVCVAVSCPI